jgi:hypothetical protein
MVGWTPKISSCIISHLRGAKRWQQKSMGIARSAGALIPQMADGYTVYCNELSSDGSWAQNGGPQERTARFGIEGDFVRACCWAEATKIFKQEGRKIPAGASRL